MLEREDIERDRRQRHAGRSSSPAQPARRRSRPADRRLLPRRVFGRIDHIGIAVNDLDAAVQLYGGSFDMARAAPRDRRGAGRRSGALEVGEGHIELIRPLSEDTGVAQVHREERRGHAPRGLPGRRHRRRARARARGGLRLIDEKPRIGIRGSRVAFLHPKSTGGVLTEIVEPAEGTDGQRDAQRSTSASPAGGCRR